MAGRILKPKKQKLHPYFKGYEEGIKKMMADRAQARAPELAKKEAAEKAALTVKFVDEQHVRTAPKTQNVTKKPKFK
ncbi:MAG: hypothetical protein ACK5X0_08465 [Rhodospirillales bacterium]